ncbi:hypothetical protein [Paenibacillus sp. Leaf72]|uniref:hypothetical protein n=1 Tax=Paenibacillus sp. Leaf72 TaxID=1736234 RepID=UPI000AD7565B|nr:hypothetical protein [Paenibacillus sp. Leaf72]
MKNAILNEFSLIYTILAIAALKHFGFLERESLQGWIALIGLIILGVALKKPADVLFTKMRFMSRKFRCFVFIENVAIVCIAFASTDEIRLWVALIGLLFILLTIHIGARFISENNE